MKRRAIRKQGWPTRAIIGLLRGVQLASDMYFLKRGTPSYKTGGYYRPPSEILEGEKVEHDMLVARKQAERLKKLLEERQETGNSEELEQYLYGKMMTFSNEVKDDN